MPTNAIVSKNITVSDEVYRRLKQEKGDRSFSEVIAAHLNSGGRLADVTGHGILNVETYEEATDETERQGEGTLERFEDETS